MKPLLVPPDAERAIVDYLTAQLLARGDDREVGTELPRGWTTASPDFVQVADDGGPVYQRILHRKTVRITTWSGHKSRGKALAGLCLGLVLIHPGDDQVASVPADGVSGILPALDPATKGCLASFTAAVNLLAQPL
ncbi:hypothetical protein [Rhizomonospora bruguierae]|uniref:hypothetical protein n=1 Tax=Rhizomonospora bruguierae TaxID=1581705 RepID=UPI001BCF38A6|nr:hypothetical protein [Micromonospora sp. NBRC 107566]